MKKLLILACLLIFAAGVFSQAYITAVGTRLGDDFGVSLQQRISKRNTVEGIFSGGLFTDDYKTAVLVEQHFPLFFKTFNFYLGAGIGAQWNKLDIPEQTYDKSLMIPVTLGLELTIGRLNVSADYLPQFVLDKSVDKKFSNSSAISLRYVIIKNDKKRKKAKKKRKKKKAKQKKQKAKSKKKSDKPRTKVGQFFYDLKEKIKPKEKDGNF